MKRRISRRPMRLRRPPFTLSDLSPTAVSSQVVSAAVRRISERHPAILPRMGDAAGRRFLFDVKGAPIVLLLVPAACQVTLHSRHAVPPYDVAIRGRLSAFFQMMDSAQDGDALFFAGELEITGDTGAAVALRNALDDADLDLADELASFLAAPRAVADRMKRLVARARHLPGLRRSMAR